MAALLFQHELLQPPKNQINDVNNLFLVQCVAVALLVVVFALSSLLSAVWCALLVNKGKQSRITLIKYPFITFICTHDTKPPYPL